MIRKRFTRKLFFLLLSFVGGQIANASSYQDQLLRDPLYQRAHSVCETSFRSEVRNAIDPTIEDVQSIKTGLAAALEFKPFHPLNDRLREELDSDAYFEGLIDCFGNTDMGLMEVKLYMSEKVLEDSAVQAVTTVAGFYVSWALSGALLDWVFQGVGRVGLAIPMVRNIAEASPDLFPRLGVLLRSSLFAAFLTSQTKSGLADGKKISEQTTAAPTAMVDHTLSSIQADMNINILPPEEMKKEIEVLKEQKKTCSSRQACDEVQTELSAFQAQLSRI